MKEMETERILVHHRGHSPSSQQKPNTQVVKPKTVCNLREVDGMGARIEEIGGRV
jgi:hypothetical protein